MLDKIRSAALSGYVKNKFGGYLENGDFSAELNTSEGWLKISATLAGETSPTTFDILKFDLQTAENGKDKMLLVRAVASNRLWLQKLAEDKLVNKPVLLPSFVSGAL